MSSRNDHDRSAAPRRRKWALALIPALAAAAFIAAAPAGAQEWDLSVGAGFYADSVYAGSDDSYVAPLVSFRAVYARRPFTYFASMLEGVGVGYATADGRVAASLSLGFGAMRDRSKYSRAGFDVDHSARTLDLLEGSPNLKTPVSTRASVSYRTRAGAFGATLEYHPTTVESGLPGVGDEVRHGFLGSLSYSHGVALTGRLSLSGQVGLEFMDRNYARAWYSVERATEALEAFGAGAGLRDARAAVQLDYALSQRIVTTLVYVDTILLQDARRSPYTVDNNQRTLCLMAVYGL